MTRQQTSLDRVRDRHIGAPKWSAVEPTQRILAARRSELILGLALLLAALLAPPNASAQSCKSGEVPDRCCDSIAPEYTQLDPWTRLRVQTHEDVASMRADMIGVIWSGGSMPTREPERIEADVGLPPRACGSLGSAGVYPCTSNADCETQPGAGNGYCDIGFENVTFANLLRNDRLHIELQKGFHSYPNVFVPIQSNGRAVIAHNGHNRPVGSAGMAEIARDLVEAGFTVIMMAMPGCGDYDGTTQIGPSCTSINHCCDHSISMPSLAEPGFDPLELFIEPVIVVVNWAAARFDEVSMLGHSGGGWTTAVSAAIDPRIRQSFENAGSLPDYLLHAPCLARGDWEQRHTGLLAAADYLDMQVLGGAGPFRRHVQLHNQWDSCCFYGLYADTYKDVTEARTAELCGEWSHWLNTYQGSEGLHRINAANRERIMSGLATRLTSGACDPATCGNGVIEPPEQCDDGNTSEGDACDANCRVTLAGDANADGVVNGADYTVWADHFGRPDAAGPLDGDFDDDGLVDGLDYTIWANAFAAPTEAAGTGASAPSASTDPVEVACGLGFELIGLLAAAGCLRSLVRRRSAAASNPGDVA